MTRPGLIILISAPSGGGKSSLCQRLLNWSANLVYSVSATTRPPRGGEQDGRDYFFVSPEEFERRAAAGEFLEWAQYNGQRYGTPREFVEEHLAAGRDVLLDIDVQGAAQVVGRVRGGGPTPRSGAVGSGSGRAGGFAHPESLVTIFLMPPALELLETRLRRRGTDSEETIRRRLTLAQQEMAHWREYDYVIVSGHLDDDFAQGQAIVTAEKCRTVRQPKDKPWQVNELSF